MCWGCGGSGVGGWRLEVGGWRLVVGGWWWRFVTGGLGLVVGVGGCGARAQKKMSLGGRSFMSDAPSTCGAACEAAHTCRSAAAPKAKNNGSPKGSQKERGGELGGRGRGGGGGLGWCWCSGRRPGVHPDVSAHTACAPTQRLIVAMPGMQFVFFQQLFQQPRAGWRAGGLVHASALLDGLWVPWRY